MLTIAVAIMGLAVGFVIGFYLEARVYWRHLDRDIEAMRGIDASSVEALDVTLVAGVTY